MRLRRLRSPSLFVTFAAAFLGVLILGTVLQAFVVFRLVGSILERNERSDAEALVTRVADAMSAEFAQSEAPDLAAVLDAYPMRPDSLILIFRARDGEITLASRLRPMMAIALARALSTDKPLQAGDVLARPRGPRGEARPGRGGGPGRASPGPARRPPFGGRGERFAAPRVLAVAAVHLDEDGVGQVAALHRGPPPGPLPPLRRHAVGFWLFLPLAILLAGAAGLVVFRSLLGRITKLEALTGRVAAGDLSVRVDDLGADEIGRLGAALNRMAENLAAAKRSVDATHSQRRRLFADISHELATPLTSIRGYTETLLNREVALSTAERASYMRHIRDASTRMGLLLEDLLELTRLESRAIQFTKERLDWATLCRNTVERFAPRFHAAKLTTQWQGPDTGAWIMADGRRMEQVIDNLLINALRYVGEGGTVRIMLEVSTPTRLETTGSEPSGSARPAGATWHRLTVTDDGPGFRPDDVEHVFDRFFRGRLENPVNGSGLGLAIVKQIVHNHGGHVRAWNGSPSGAVVAVELPALES